MADADATELQGDGKALGGNARKKRGRRDEDEEEEAKGSAGILRREA